MSIKNKKRYLENIVEMYLYKNKKVIKELLEINNLQNMDIQVEIFSCTYKGILKRDMVVLGDNKVYLIEISVKSSNFKKHLNDIKSDININLDKGFRTVVYISDNLNELKFLKNMCMDEVREKNIRVILVLLSYKEDLKYIDYRNLDKFSDYIKNLDLEFTKIFDIEEINVNNKLLTLNDIYKYYNNDKYINRIINDIRKNTFYKNVINYKEVKYNSVKFGLGKDNLFFLLKLNDKKNILKLKIKGNKVYKDLIKFLEDNLEVGWDIYYLNNKYESEVKRLANNIHNIINFIYEKEYLQNNIHNK
ncbi:hypothetical protein LTY04_001644 [Clostridium perfringens]